MANSAQGVMRKEKEGSQNWFKSENASIAGIEELVEDHRWVSHYPIHVKRTGI